MRSLSTTPEFLSADECRALAGKIQSLARGGGTTLVSIVSEWRGMVRWARNRVFVASDIRTIDLSITRTIGGVRGEVTTSRMDDVGLEEAVRGAEQLSKVLPEVAEQIEDPFIDEPILTPVLWSDATYRFGAAERVALVDRMMAGAISAKFRTAGELAISASGTATISTEGMSRYYPRTSVECSLTVRDPNAAASGWAGVSHSDLTRIDPMALAATALDKCRRSANPSAIEPGRYTAVLEPQATADLFGPVMGLPLDRAFTEGGGLPFSGNTPNSSKLTEHVLDRRLILRADPMEADGGFLPFDRYDGSSYRPVDWIDRGILRELAYDRPYALRALNRDAGLPNSGSYKLIAAPDVPTATIEEMIARTKRGLLVTRFSDVEMIGQKSVLCRGFTRDGVWLIENGAFSRPVKNFRFQESPLFILNNLDDIGAPQRVFAPAYARLAPPVRVRDFNFSALADSV